MSAKLRINHVEKLAPLPKSHLSLPSWLKKFKPEALISMNENDKVKIHFKTNNLNLIYL